VYEYVCVSCCDDAVAPSLPLLAYAYSHFLHYKTPHFTTIHCTTLHYTSPHNTTLHCTALHNTTQYNTTQVIDLDPSGSIRSFRFNYYDRAPLTYLPPKDIPLYYRHLQSLVKLIKDDRGEEEGGLTFKYPLQRGEAVITDNLRVMHGREGFTIGGEGEGGEEGPRNFRGCYISRDDYWSRVELYGLSGPTPWNE